MRPLGRGTLFYCDHNSTISLVVLIGIPSLKKRQVHFVFSLSSFGNTGKGNDVNGQKDVVSPSISCIQDCNDSQDVCESKWKPVLVEICFCTVHTDGKRPTQSFFSISSKNNTKHNTRVCALHRLPINPLLLLSQVIIVITMFGNTHRIAQQRRTLNGRALQARHSLGRNRLTINRPTWPAVSDDIFFQKEHAYMHEPGMTVFCPHCNKNHAIGLKHWTSDRVQGCKYMAVLDKVQHGFHVLTRDHGHQERLLSVSSLRCILQAANNLDHLVILAQEDDWLPNENLFTRDAMNNWVETQVNICHLFDNVIPQNSKLVPIAQDVNRDLWNRYRSEGSTIFSTAAIVQRRSFRETNTIIKPILRDISKDILPCVMQYGVMQNLFYQLKAEIGSAKRHLEHLHSSGVLNNTQHQDVMNCFSDAANFNTDMFAGLKAVPLNECPATVGQCVTAVNQPYPRPTCPTTKLWPTDKSLLRESSTGS